MDYPVLCISKYSIYSEKEIKVKHWAFVEARLWVILNATKLLKHFSAQWARWFVCLNCFSNGIKSIKVSLIKPLDLLQIADARKTLGINLQNQTKLPELFKKMKYFC